MGRAGALKALDHRLIAGDVNFAQDAANLRCDLLAPFPVEVEKGNLHAFGCKGARGGLAQTAGAASDDC